MLTNLARLCAASGRLTDAVAYGEQAKSALVTLKHRAPTIEIKTMAVTADILATAGRWRDAETLYKHALALCEKTFGSDHYLVGHVLTMYAAFLSETDRKSEAKDAEKRAEVLRERFAQQNATGHTVDAKSFAK